MRSHREDELRRRERPQQKLRARLRLGDDANDAVRPHDRVGVVGARRAAAVDGDAREEVHRLSDRGVARAVARDAPGVANV
jgi:hypothetical protein